MRRRLGRQMLNKMFVMVVAWLVSSFAAASAQSNAQARIREALAAMGGEQKLRALSVMKLEGIAHQYFLEQSERPEGPWLVDYQEFSELHEISAMRLRRTTRSRSILSPEGRTVTTYVNAGAAAFNFNGRFFPAPASEVQEAEELLALMPEHALLHALEAQDLREESGTTLQGVKQNVLACTWQGKILRLFLNANTALPTAAELVSDHPYHMFWSVWGEVATRVYYSTWMIETGGLRYPRQFDLTRHELPWRAVTITQLNTNPPAAPDSFSIPAEIREAFTKNKLTINELPLGWRGRKPASELAPNIVKIPAGWDVALVRQDDGIIIIEAPISSNYAAQVIAEAERRFPGVPIKAVISTSDAWPHVAGLREYAAREIPIYALDLNQKLLERVLASSHRNHPDSLARRPRAPRFHAVANKTVVGTGRNRLEIYPIRGEGSERMMMVYFPEHGLLYGSDLIQQYPDGSFFMPQYLSELVAAVRENNLAVQTVFAMHARAMPWNDIVAAVAQAMAEAPQAGTAN